MRIVSGDTRRLCFKMAFYSRSAREEANRRNVRAITSESASDSVVVQQQLNDLMKIMKDQKEAVEACLTENKKLNDKLSNLQESVKKLKDTNAGGRKKIPYELSVRI